jgi:hypothetical protein
MKLVEGCYKINYKKSSISLLAIRIYIYSLGFQIITFVILVALLIIRMALKKVAKHFNLTNIILQIAIFSMYKCFILYIVSSFIFLSTDKLNNYNRNILKRELSFDSIGFIFCFMNLLLIVITKCIYFFLLSYHKETSFEEKSVK